MSDCVLREAHEPVSLPELSRGVGRRSGSIGDRCGVEASLRVPELRARVGGGVL